MSKRATAIEIMTANPTKPMSEVVALIAAAIEVTEGNAKSYYKWIVANGKAPGVVEKTVKSAPKESKAKTEKTAKQPTKGKAKIVKVPAPKVQGEKSKVTDKTVEEIEDIKNKNLARLKEVHRKYKKGQYAEGKEGGFTTAEAEAAREYVDSVNESLDSFKSPEFLTMDEVKALV